MAKVLKAVGTVAGVVAMIPGPWQLPAAIISAVALVGAQVTAKKPGSVAQGSVNQRILGANNAQPYMIGRSYTGGVQVHDAGWGGKVGDVQNPYRFIAALLSVCGPVQAIESVQVDYSVQALSGTAATGYYSGYLWVDKKLGARPESAALAPQWSGCPDWGSAYKLSSHAQLGYSLKWDKEGERFPGGQMPVLGAIVSGVKVYDPRLDSTYPGGSGSCRLGNESTYVYSASPALHSATYAYGRYVSGVKVFGVGLGAEGVEWADVVPWANTCDANGWAANGTIYEPGDKANNLRRIAEAGAGVAVQRGGVIGFDFQAPRTSLYTIGIDDLAGDIRARSGKGWKSRHNVLVPRYRAEDQQWNYAQAAEVANAGWIAADGERKVDERQWDLVTDVDQVTELAIYDLHQRREAGPFIVPCKPHMRHFDPGDCLTLGADLGVHPAGAVKCVLRRTSRDPGGVVTMEFEAETDAKHVAAIGAAGAGPDPRVLPTSAELDGAAWQNALPAGYGATLTATSYVTLASGVSVLLSATATTITVASHYRQYSDKVVAVTGATVSVEDDGTTPIDDAAAYYLYYDDAARAGGAVAFKATRYAPLAINSAANPTRHFVGAVTTDTVGGTGTSGGGATPPGFGGGSGGAGWNTELPSD